MLNKRFITGSLLVGLITTIAVSSCTKKIDEAYLSPNAPVVVPIETLLPSAITNMVAGSNPSNGGNGIAADDVNIGNYIQYWNYYTPGYQYDEMGGTTGNNGGTLGYVWTMHYVTMGQNVSRIIEWGSQQKKWDYVGVAYALRAWSWLTLSDQYGNIILREAFDVARTTFDYDTVQSEAYDTVRATAYRALAYLSMTGDSVSPANLAKGDPYFYGGDVNKWKKLVYGVLARSYAHLSNKPKFAHNYADSVIKFTGLAMQTNDDNGVLKFANSGISATMNFFGPTRLNGIRYQRQGAYIANLMSGSNSQFLNVVDPRIYYFLRENANGTFKGVVPNYGNNTPGLSGAGIPNQPANFWGTAFATTTAPNDSKARYLFTNSAPFPVMTASEMQFLKAEAQFRNGDKASALATYVNAINLNLDMVQNNYSANVPAAGLMTPASRAAFMGNALVVPTDPNQLTLGMIMMQKYIAMFGHNAHETWVDMRRYHYTDLDPTNPSGTQQVYADFTPPSGNDLFPNNLGKFVYRCRPQNTSEFQYNLTAVTAMGGTAIDYCTREVWFSTNQ